MRKVQYISFSSVLLTLFTYSCTTPESDFTTNFQRPIYETRVNTEPLSREERIRFTQIENERFRNLVNPVREFMNKLLAERSAFVTEIERDFPKCKNQRYCQSQVSVGSVQDFERYNALVSKVHRYDYQIVDLESKIKELERTHDIRLRNYYNRYLVREILRLFRSDGPFHNVMVHSLETYPSRVALSRSLLRLVQDLPGVQSTDYDFTQYGKEIDEAAVVLTLDVWRAPLASQPSTRFLTTLLINAQSLDDQFYEKPFLDEWTKIFLEPNFENLKKSVFCHIYGIASPSLAVKMFRWKRTFCAEKRAELRTAHDKFDYNFMPSAWVLPLTFAQVKSPNGP